MSFYKLPEIGDWVTSSHPISIANPDKYFQIYDINYNVGKFWVRGKGTVWFCIDLISKGHNPVIDQFEWIKQILPTWDCMFDEHHFGSIDRCVPEYNENKEYWANYFNADDGWDDPQGFDTLEEAKIYLSEKFLSGVDTSF